MNMTTSQIRQAELNRLFNKPQTIRRTFAELREGDSVRTGPESFSRIESIVKMKTYTMCELADETVKRFYGLVECLNETH